MSALCVCPKPARPPRLPSRGYSQPEPRGIRTLALMRGGVRGSGEWRGLGATGTGGPRPAGTHPPGEGLHPNPARVAQQAGSRGAGRTAASRAGGRGGGGPGAAGPAACRDRGAGPSAPSWASAVSRAGALPHPAPRGPRPAGPGVPSTSGESSSAPSSTAPSAPDLLSASATPLHPRGLHPSRGFSDGGAVDRPCLSRVPRLARAGATWPGSVPSPASSWESGRPCLSWITAGLCRGS